MYIWFPEPLFTLKLKTTINLFINFQLNSIQFHLNRINKCHDKSTFNQALKTTIFLLFHQINLGQSSQYSLKIVKCISFCQ